MTSRMALATVMRERCAATQKSSKLIATGVPAFCPGTPRWSWRTATTVQIFHAGGDSSGRAAAAKPENRENGFQAYFDGGRTGTDALASAGPSSIRVAGSADAPMMRSTCSALEPD